GLDLLVQQLLQPAAHPDRTGVVDPGDRPVEDGADRGGGPRTDRDPGPAGGQHDREGTSLRRHAHRLPLPCRARTGARPVARSPRTSAASAVAAALATHRTTAGEEAP